MCTVDGRVRRCSHSGKLGSGLQNLKLEPPYNPAIRCWVFIQISESRVPERHLYPHVQSSALRSSRKVGATQALASRWADKPVWSMHTMEYCPAQTGSTFRHLPPCGQTQRTLRSGKDTNHQKTNTVRSTESGQIQRQGRRWPWCG